MDEKENTFGKRKNSRMRSKANDNAELFRAGMILEGTLDDLVSLLTSKQEETGCRDEKGWYEKRRYGTR